jgi:hypothetical protein
MDLMQNGDKPKMPSVAAIVQYWQSQKAQIAVDWKKAADYCWRCGKQLIRGTAERNSEDNAFRHRAHIIPRSLGGSDEPSNIIILCRHCHVLAPDVVDPQFMWNWLGTNGASDPTLMLWRLAYIEYEILFGKFPVPEAFAEIILKGACGSTSSLALVASDLNVDERNAFMHLFNKAVIAALDKAERHQGKHSVSTLAWIFRQAVLYAEGKPSAVCDMMPIRSQPEIGGSGEVIYKQQTFYDMFNETEKIKIRSADSPDGEESCISELRATVEFCIPNFVKAVESAVEQSSNTGSEKIIICHQDSFASQYEEGEYALLGMAIKYAGLYGVNVTIIGKNHETL